MSSARLSVHRLHEHSFKNSGDFRKEIAKNGLCNIYVVARDGSIDPQDDVPFTDGARRLLNVAEKEKSDMFENEDRLTLVQLQENEVFPKLEKGKKPKALDELWYEHLPAMPTFFEDKLKKICDKCQCKSDILWRNLHRPEQHFDACFRYHDDKAADEKVVDEKVADETAAERVKKGGRCFLKLYTMRVPFIAEERVAFSMVHHVRAEGNKFVPATYMRKGIYEAHQENKEHIFAFVSGFSSKQIGSLLVHLLHRWQDIPKDHSNMSTGMTPRLLAAAIISQYGHIITNSIINAKEVLDTCDMSFKTAIDDLEIPGRSRRDQIEATTKTIKSMNQDLIYMNRELSGTRSTMHYLAESAEILANKIITFQEYIMARLKDWDSAEKQDLEALEGGLPLLDSCKEHIRDNDKLLMVGKSMRQSKTDIKTLQQHIDINVGMVRNLIAERDRTIQLDFLKASDKDASNMKVIAILTAFFLPGTFMAIFLTTPMFNFDPTKTDVPTMIKYPTKIYWIVTGTLTFVFLAGATFMTEIKWISLLKKIPLIKKIPFIQRISSFKSFSRKPTTSSATQTGEGNGATENQPSQSNEVAHNGNQEIETTALVNDNTAEHGSHGPSTGGDAPTTQLLHNTPEVMV